LKVSRLLFLFLVILFFTGNQSIAQDSRLKPLGVFLNVLEKRFDVVFSFVDSSIKDIYIIPPRKDLSLDDCLVNLEGQTNLDFERLNARYVAIRRCVGDLVVSGTVVDSSTKEYLSGALVYCGKKYVFTDVNGRFSLRVNSGRDSVLTVRYTGHKPLLIKQHSWTDLSSVYELVPDVLALDEVVVNYIARGISKGADGSIQLNVRNIEVLPGLSEPDVLHTLQVLPGVQSVNETVSDISIRGGTNDQNLVLWDGVKMYQTGHFFGLISAFNSHLIHKTRIVKNGASASYAEGVSGIIDMSLQDYAVNDFELSAGINMISADAIVKVPVSKKLSLVLGARHSINELFVSPTYMSYFNRAFDQTEILENDNSNNIAVDDYHDFSFYDLSCKLLYDFSDKDKLRLSFLRVDNKIDYEESAFIEGLMHKKRSYLKQSSTLFNFNYTHLWSAVHSTMVSAIFSSYCLDGTNVELLSGQHHMQTNEVTDCGFKLDSKYRINRNIGLSGGYQFNEIGIRNQDNIFKPDYNKSVKEVLSIHSLYSEAEFKRLFDRLYMRVGLRANYYSKFSELLFEPRAALNFRLTDYISFEASAERKNQHTMQSIDYQTDFLGVEKRRWVLSNNESVPILNSQQFSVGANFNRNNFLISVEGYVKNVTGIISPSQGFQNQFQYVYANGEYNTQGVELLANKRLKQSNIWINYTLAKNEYHFKDYSPSAFPNNLDIRHTVSLGGSYNINSFEVSGGINYRTGKPYTPLSQTGTTTDDDIIYDEPNSSHLDDFLRLDISAKYHFKLKNIKGEFGASIWNILNTQNDINIYYQQNTNHEIEQITNHALGITPNIYLRLRF